MAANSIGSTKLPGNFNIFYWVSFFYRHVLYNDASLYKRET